MRPDLTNLMIQTHYLIILKIKSARKIKNKEHHNTKYKFEVKEMILQLPYKPFYQEPRTQIQLISLLQGN